MNQQLQFPVDDIRQVVRACGAEELKPDDPRWYDFAALRHASILQRLRTTFSDPPESGQYHQQVLCGHRGCGKSTELLRFKSWADENGYRCERIEVDVHYGQAELEFSDFYLMAASAAERALENTERPIPETYIKPVVEWFAEVTEEKRTQRKSELSVEAGAQLGGTVPFGLGKLFAKFASAIKAASEHARIVRQQMRSYPDQLIDLTNQLLRQAHRNLELLGIADGLVLVFDNLDRYDPDHIGNALMRVSHLQRMASHAIFTIPIDLEYNPRYGPTRDAFGQPIILPMVSLRQRDAAWKDTVAESPHEQTAVQGMVEALGKRIVVNALFADPQDAVVLAKMSGGCIRDLMHLVRLSRQMSDGSKIDSEAVRRAVQELRNTHLRELSPEHYGRLAEIAARKAVPKDELTQTLLYNRWVLQYYDQNGRDWIDVHPLVVEIDEFRHAFEKHRVRIV